MKINHIVKIEGKKLQGGSLPDIDTDFASEDRTIIKNYMESRYGKMQVCSVGTVTTFKPRGLVKDLSRIASVDYSLVNLITSIFDKDASTLLDIIKTAVSENKLKGFIKDNSDIFFDLPILLGQPKAKSIHACAMIVFPNVMSATMWAPMRIQDGQLVSEWGGGELDNAGFLKEDILGIKQLSKFTDILNLISKNEKIKPNIYNLPYDAEVYRYFGNGWNGDVFQMGSSGLTQYTKALKPQTIDDLIAANALYRPGPMENHYHEIYVKCKNEGRAPQFLWGTEKITKDTYGLVIYQEQVMKIFQELGGLSMKEADDVRRALGKKDLKYLLGWKETVLKGFLDKGATEEQFNETWVAIEEFAKYSFNKSHSAAYAKTGYISQWLKVNFPLEYWTVAIKYADIEKSLLFLSEISQAKVIKVLPPNINYSETTMTSDSETNSIYWGIESIKGIGEKTAEQIIDIRNKLGDYESFDDFYKKNKFKGSAVKKQTYEALISVGAFDSLNKIEDNIEDRVDILNHFRETYKIKISNTKIDSFINGMVHERWWWGLKQKELTGLSFINYDEIIKNDEFEYKSCSGRDLSIRQDRGINRSFGGYIVDFRENSSAKGKFCRLTIENNYRFHKVIIWADAYSNLRPILKKCENSIIVFDGKMKYEGKYTKGNQFTIEESNKVILLK